MKILTCYMAPSDGDAKVNDLSILEYQDEIKKIIRYLPENNPLYYDMPVLEYLKFVADLQGVPKEKIQDRIGEMVYVCGLNVEKHKKIGELSKGFRQRVGLAQAMIHDPEILILDGPTTGLDPNQIVEIRKLIKEIGKHKTVILSTHILPEVEATCDRILIINKGKIVADGTSDMLRKRAVITNYQVIGAGYTPVRAVIDRAAAFIDRPKACFALVVSHDGLAGIYFGSPEEAWQSAAELSAQKHIVYVKKPFQRVLSIMPEMYDDLWTAAKGMYKMEPAVADGGEIVIYAPHITEVSYTHGKIIDEIGYHCRDYFMKQWETFKNFPGGVLAHSTHVRGLGSYDPQTDRESVRIHVTLATRIPPERCACINLGYLDPDNIRIENRQNREDQGILVVPHAGELLYRIKE